MKKAFLSAVFLVACVCGFASDPARTGNSRKASECAAATLGWYVEIERSSDSPIVISGQAEGIRMEGEPTLKRFKLFGEWLDILRFVRTNGLSEHFNLEFHAHWAKKFYKHGRLLTKAELYEELAARLNAPHTTRVQLTVKDAQPFNDELSFVDLTKRAAEKGILKIEFLP